jgi:hypothetical protein
MLIQNAIIFLNIFLLRGGEFMGDGGNVASRILSRHLVIDEDEENDESKKNIEPELEENHLKIDLSNKDGDLTEQNTEQTNENDKETDYMPENNQKDEVISQKEDIHQSEENEQKSDDKGESSEEKATVSTDEINTEKTIKEKTDSIETKGSESNEQSLKTQENVNMPEISEDNQKFSDDDIVTGFNSQTLDIGNKEEEHTVKKEPDKELEELDELDEYERFELSLQEKKEEENSAKGEKKIKQDEALKALEEKINEGIKVSSQQLKEGVGQMNEEKELNNIFDTDDSEEKGGSIVLDFWSFIFLSLRNI